MALLIKNTTFATGGASLTIDSIYVDVAIIFPQGTQNAEAILSVYPMFDGVRGNKKILVDGISKMSFSPIALIKTDFWNDINAGNAHDYIISKLEENNPDWVGKISKIIPKYE